MIANKVSFSAHTKEMLNARPLSRTAKSKLRRQRIVEYIRELPIGECRKKDLISAAGWDISDERQYSLGWAFVNRLISSKVILMSDGTDPKNSYIRKWDVAADTRVKKPAHVDKGPGYTHSEGDNCAVESTTVTNDHGKMTYPEGDGEITISSSADGPEPAEEVAAPEPTWAPRLEPVIVTDEPSAYLLEQAKTFAWNTNSDSLREFIAWVKR